MAKRLIRLPPMPQSGQGSYRKWLEIAKQRRARALALQGEGKSLWEIGDMLGVSKQRVVEILAQARREVAVVQQK